MATIKEAVDHIIARMNVEPWECDAYSDEEIESLYSYTVSEDGLIELVAPDGTVFQATLVKKEA